MRKTLASILNPMYISKWEHALGNRRWLAIVKLLSLFFFITLPLDFVTLYGAYATHRALEGNFLSYPWGILGIMVFSYVFVKELIAFFLYHQIPQNVAPNSAIHLLHIQWIHNLVYMLFLYKSYDPRSREFKLNREEFLPDSVLDYPWEKAAQDVLGLSYKFRLPRSQSLVRFIKERVNFPDTGNLDTSFLIFTGLLPRKEDLSVDGIKSILLAYPRFYMEEVFKKISKDFLEDNSKINHFFSNYSEEDLKKIFLRRYDAYHFYIVIQMISEKTINYTPFPLMNSLREIYDYVLVDKPRNTFHLNLTKVDMIQTEQFSFKLLRTEREYRLWGNKLRNCIKDQCWNQTGTDIVGIFKDKEFYAAASFAHEKLSQIKLADNKEVPLEEQKELLDVLNQYLQ